MTFDSPPEFEVTNPNEFRTALQALLATAAQNDVDPRGAWEYRTPDDTPDLEVMVVELASKEPSD